MSLNLYLIKKKIDEYGDEIEFKEYLSINFNHVLKKWMVSNFNVNFKVDDKSCYSITIEVSTYCNKDTYVMYDTYCDENIKKNEIHNCYLAILEYSDLLEEGKCTEFNEGVFEDAVSKVRIDKQTFMFDIEFETLDDILDFIKYYDSVDKDYNILDDYYHLIFVKTRDYKNYLKTKHWQNLRAKFLKKANYKCQLCGISGENVIFNVHHNNYNNLGNEDETDVIVLCRVCHEKYHDKHI